MRRTGVAPYRWLAEYYDRVFTAQHPWVETARREILGAILPGVESACDLACGTGTTALNLARRGIRMHAVDLSPGMCRAVRRRAREGGLPVRVRRADMRSFHLPRPVDLVLCELDALNHLPRKSDLDRVAAAVARALKPGGFFFFDVNNRLGFETYWKGSFWLEKPGLVLAMNNGNDARNDRAWSDCEWFVRQGRLWRRHRERVEEVCWSRAEITAALRANGFDRVRVWDSAPFMVGNPVVTRGCRSHYLARKRPEGSPRAD
jgi:SAM-dependent methyltransferase